MKKYIPLIMLVMMVVVFFGPVLFTGRIFYLWDLCFGFYPAYHFVGESLRQGIVPLWNPYMGCGEPFLADIETGILYPPNWVHLFLPTGLGIGVVTCFHVLLAGVGTYGLARAWRVSPMGSLLAGMSYAFSSYTISHIEFPTELGCAAWFPVCMAALMYCFRRGGLRSLLVLAVTLSLQFLTGFPETMAFGLGAMALCALFVGVARWTSSGRWTRLFSPALGLGIAGVVAVLLAMALFLPTWEALGTSSRTGTVDKTFDIGSIHPMAIFSLLVPSVYGTHAPFTIFWGNYWAPSCLTYWVGTFYVGLVPVAVFVAVAFRRCFGGRLVPEAGVPRDEWLSLRVPYFATVLVIFFIYAMGKYTPFCEWSRQIIPFLRHFVTPSKCLVCVVLPLSCLAGIGWDRLAEAGSSPVSDRGGWRHLLSRWGPGLAFAVVGVVVIVLLADHGRLGKVVLTRCFNLGAVAPSFAHRIPWDIIVRDSIKLPIVGLLASLLLYFYTSKRQQRGVLAWMIVVLAFVDLYMSNAHVLSPGPESILADRPDGLASLRPDGKIVRYLGFEHLYLDEHQRMVAKLVEGRPVRPLGVTDLRPAPGKEYETMGRMLRNAQYLYWPVVDHAFNANGFSRLGPGDLRRLIWFLLTADVSPEAKSRLLSMMNCDRVLLWPDLKELFAQGRIEAPRLAILPEPLPRAYVVGGVRVLEKGEQVLQALFFTPIEPLKEALTDRGSAAGDTFRDLRPGMIKQRLNRLDYVPNGLEIDITAEKDGILVVSDTYDDGWVASVNGKAVPVIRVNYAFRGVRVPSGTSQIKMTYRPASFRWGIIISLTTLVAALILAAVETWRKTRV